MIKELHEKIVSGDVTAVQLVEKHLAVIEEKDPQIEAFLTLENEKALKTAAAVDAKVKNGEQIDLLAGIPCALKDNICVKGGRTTAASRSLDNYIAPYDATVTKRVQESDAIVLGKTNLDEFACGSSTENSAYQITKNPADVTRVAGGSSGGSVAAVASGEAVWALGTDTGGSIRQPSSFCGTVGLKPTYGRVSRYGVIAMGSSLDQVGPVTTSAEDAAIVLSRIAGHDDHDATSAESSDKKYEEYLRGDMKGAKIGVPFAMLEEGIADDVKESFMASIDKFKERGATIEDIVLPHAEYGLPVYYIIMPAELSSNLARIDSIRYGMRANDHEGHDGRDAESVIEQYMDARQYGFGPEVKRRLMLGTYTLSAGYYDAYYKKAQKVRALIRKDFEDVYKKVDYIYTPTTPETAFKVGEKTDDPLTMYLSDIFTVTANLAGVPAISFPINAQGGGLPIGGQLMGKWFDEEGILNAVHTFETI